MDNTPVQPGPATVEVEDLYCLHCGYNLRGLPGDPRVCPECGRASSVADMRIPAELIRKQARKLETLPLLCVGAVLFGLMFGLPFLVVQPAIAGVIFILAVVCWVAFARAFARNCEHQSGWLMLIAEFHAAALLFIAPFSVWFGGCFVLVVYAAGWFSLVFMVAGSVVLALAIFVYQDARRRLVVLRRGAAVQLARKELAKPKYLRRFPSGLPRDYVAPGDVP
jgi:O-antigen/teichoic acid export membrane protein